MLCGDINNLEWRLISKAKCICKYDTGREFFTGGEPEFNLISHEIDSITNGKTLQLVDKTLETVNVIFDTPINYCEETGMYSATDLVRAGNIWRHNNKKPMFNFSQWLNRRVTEEFIEELTKKYGKCVIKGRGRNSQTWVHPLIFIDLALSIDPKLKIEVYEWLFDHLIKNRNESGDSYKKMCGTLYVRHARKQAFPKFIGDIATRIKIHCGCDDWQEANEQQLKLRDKLHNDIALLADVLNNNDEAVRLAFLNNK